MVVALGYSSWAGAKSTAAQAPANSKPPAVTLKWPPPGGTAGGQQRVEFVGAAGHRTQDLPKVTLRVFRGGKLSGRPLLVLSTTESHGRWSVTTPHRLADGIYTAQATQRDRAGRIGHSAPDTFTVVFYQSPHFYGANSHNVAYDPLGDGSVATPYDRAVCWMYGVGNVNQPISWGVGYYTGLHPPAPLSRYQYGDDNGHTGSSACQLDGNWAGAMINKDDTPRATPLYGWGLNYNWSHPYDRPWASKYDNPNLPDDPYFRLQTNWALGRNAVSTSVQYSQICAYFRDSVSGRTLIWCPEAWDSRGPQGENIGYNAIPGGVDLVLTRFGHGTKYATLHCRSQTFAQTNPNAFQPTWYAAYLSRSQLLDITSQLNSQIPPNSAKYSTDPNTFYLSAVVSGSELYAPGTDYGWIGSRVGNVIAMTDPSPCLA
jgi:Bacterial Ig-like domain